MITKTAWKNIWRNKVRSLVVIASVAIGIFSGVFAIGVMEGVMKQRVDSALNGEISHIQVTSPGFRSNNDLALYIDSTGTIMSRIRQIEGVESVTSRLVVIGMANTASKSAGVEINGVNPEDEKRVFNLYTEVYPGSGGYFDDESESGSAYIGVDLAKSLNIIRYTVTGETIESLKEKKVPPAVLEKLKPIEGERFKNEKSFKKELKRLLDPSVEMRYGAAIREEAQTFSSRSRKHPYISWQRQLPDGRTLQDCRSVRYWQWL
ncbi:MAG: ABC transporter permease [Bacteroidales bacterium]